MQLCGVLISKVCIFTSSFLNLVVAGLTDKILTFENAQKKVDLNQLNLKSALRGWWSCLLSSWLAVSAFLFYLCFFKTSQPVGVQKMVSSTALNPWTKYSTIQN